MSGRDSVGLATRAVSQAVRSGGTRRGGGRKKDDATRRAVLVLAVLAAAVLAVPAAVIAMVVLVGGAVSENQSRGDCSLSASVVPAGGQATSAGGFTGEQLQNVVVAPGACSNPSLIISSVRDP